MLDMLLVVVIAGMVAAYAVMRSNTAGENTLWYQAQKFARDVRHAQVMASTYGKPVVVTTSSTGYTVACVTTPAAAPCDTTYLVDPVTGQNFSVTFENGVTLSSAGTTFTFDNQGRPLNGGALKTTSTSVTLSAGSVSSVVAVAPITGHVSVTP